MFRQTVIIGRTGAVIMALLMFCAPVSAGATERGLEISADSRRMAAHAVKRLKVPRCYHEGLYYDGKSMWLCNGEGAKTWVIDLSSGAVSSEIEPVAGFTEAITARGDGTFYTTEWDEKQVYHVKLRDNTLVVQSSVSVAPSHPAGAIWNGKRLYVVLWDRGLLGTRFSIVEMDQDMNIVKKIPIRTIQEPDHLAWDGAYLWMTSWYDGRVYKIDIDKWEVVGYFCSPAKKTTGIAWDGSRIWLTATYDDLYQMEVAD